MQGQLLPAQEEETALEKKLPAGRQHTAETIRFAILPVSRGISVIGLIAVGRGTTVACNEVKEGEVAKQRRAVEEEVASPPLPLAGGTGGPDFRLGRCRLVRGLRRLVPKAEKASTAPVATIRIMPEEADSVVCPSRAVRTVGPIGIALGTGHKFNPVGNVVQNPYYSS